MDGGEARETRRIKCNFYVFSEFENYDHYNYVLTAPTKLTMMMVAGELEGHLR